MTTEKFDKAFIKVTGIDPRLARNMQMLREVLQMIEPSVRLNEYTQVVDRTFLFVLGAVIEKGRIDKHGKGRSFSTRLALGNNFNFSGNEIPRMLNRIHTVTSGVTWDRFASYVLRVSESTRQVIDTSTLSGYQEEN